MHHRHHQADARPRPRRLAGRAAAVTLAWLGLFGAPGVLGPTGMQTARAQAAGPGPEPTADRAEADAPPTDEIDLDEVRGSTVREPQGVPDTGGIEPNPLVQRVLGDPLTPADQRIDLLIAHGRWDELPGEAELSPDQRAALALASYRLDDPALADEAVDALLRARAALRRGEPAEAEAILSAAERDDPPARLVRARALEQLGRLHEAVGVLTPVREAAVRQRLESAEALTAAAEALVVLARLEGRPAQDYHTAMSMLGRAGQALAPLSPAPRLAEARILMAKDNRPEAVEAAKEALSLNPRSSGAWHILGSIAARGFGFDEAAHAADRLRAIHPNHPLAAAVEARSLLVQRDQDAARRVLDGALKRYPGHRELLALRAAAEAVAFDEPAMRDHLAAYDRLAPGSPQALALVGEMLSLVRQYELGEAVLREAIERQPSWPRPRLELGLLLVQAGDLPAARRELAMATRLDPFNLRTANQLALVEELLGYETIETEHFVIRYQGGIDRVLARDMPAVLESLYADVTAAFDHEPPNVTQIDILPDEQRFAVRITGMPDIWTIAAATGDVVALTPPRLGRRQAGGFYWPNVIRHEFTHTVTLSATRNRLPHWFTEAAAVSQETTGRSYATCRLLAQALAADELFAYRRINWGFVRPRTPRDRPLAYAQAHWMIQYIEQAFGRDAVLGLMARYREGVGDLEALGQVLGLGEAEFMSGFRQWARGEVASWGLATPPATGRLREVLAGEGEPAGFDELTALLAEHPGHPDLLERIAKLATETLAPDEARGWVRRYAEARPVDPWTLRAELALAEALGDGPAQVALLTELDRRDGHSGLYARRLAALHRAMGRYARAYDAAVRALHREPYNPSLRELAATLALQAGEPETAVVHLEALPLLEPDRTVHHRRLAALYQRLGRAEEAQRAREQAEAVAQPASP